MEFIIIISIFIISALLSVVSKKRAVIEFSSIISAIIAFVYSVRVALIVASSGVYMPNYFFSVDSLGAIVMLIIATVGLATTLYSREYLKQETIKNIVGFSRVKQYFILLDLFLAMMFLAATSSSPIVVWIAIEATTLSTAFLVSFYNKPEAMEAAWKYLIINSVGLPLAFLGTLLYLVNPLDPFIAKIAFIFALIGYGTKAGLAPMHTWLPDAHSKAPAPISALLSGVLLNVAMMAILRFKAITDSIVGPDFSQNLLIISGVLSITVAALIILTQKSYKRLLAYSSIENMGIISLGFGFGGVAIPASILHMIYHALLKSSLFMMSGTIFLKYSATKISKIRGMLSVIPVTSILFLAGVFAITGTPPFGVFLTKMYILGIGITTHPVVTAVVVFLLAIVFIGFFKQATAMFFGDKPNEVTAEKESVWLIIPPFALIAIVAFLSFNIPPFLLALINDVASHY